MVAKKHTDKVMYIDVMRSQVYVYRVIYNAFEHSSTSHNQPELSVL